MTDTHYIIRKAEPRDLEAVNELLQQVLSVHHKGRPDLFNEIGKKYTDAEETRWITARRP